jgi:hypothetical protein
MAIDTAEKRKSISGIHMNICPGVTPNSGQDQEWRQEAGFSYSGIAAASPPSGRIMSSLVNSGGLVGAGGIAGRGGGLAG